MLYSRKTVGSLSELELVRTFVSQNEQIETMRKKSQTILADALNSLQDIMQLLTPEQQDSLRHSMSVMHIKKNETLYQEGDVPQMLHCLIDGKVKVYKDGIGGRTQIIRVIKPVEYFGYRAYFANQNYVTSAAAFEPSTVCLIPNELIEKWISENHRLALFFIKMLAVEVGNSDQRTVNLTQKHIRGRLAESLIFLRDNYGLEEDGATLSIYLSREDLANMSNMTTSNAIRTLSAFAQEKIIAIDGKKIKIIDGDHLEKISKIG